MQNRELQIMRKLEHPNIVKLKYFFYSSGDKVSLLSLSLSYPMSFFCFSSLLKISPAPDAHLPRARKLLWSSYLLVTVRFFSISSLHCCSLTFSSYVLIIKLTLQLPCLIIKLARILKFYCFGLLLCTVEWCFVLSSHSAQVMI